MLKRFGSGPDNAALLGDLAEQYAEKNSAWWYWRQTLGGIVVTTFKDIRNHKLLTLRALTVGWLVFWLLLKGLGRYGVPFFQPVTQVVVEGLFKGLFAVRSLFEVGVVGALSGIYSRGRVVGPANRFEFMLFLRSVGHVENVAWFFYGALATLSFCIVGILSGWILGRLHRRKVSIVLAHAATVLAYWVVPGLGIHHESYPPFYWNIAILTLSIVLGGVLCASRKNTTLQKSVSF